jgi:hypothetical protein
MAREMESARWDLLADYIQLAQVEAGGGLHGSCGCILRECADRENKGPGGRDAG